MLQNYAPIQPKIVSLTYERSYVLRLLFKLQDDLRRETLWVG